MFVNEFLDAVEEKLESLVCLYCEKVFKSRDVLKVMLSLVNNARLLLVHTVYILGAYEKKDAQEAKPEEQDVGPILPRQLS